MNRLFLFIKSIYLPLLFIILEVVAINYYTSSTTYTRAKALGVKNAVTGGISRRASGIKGYFDLRSENRKLVDELTQLRNELETYKTTEPESIPDSLPAIGDAAKYIYASASVINNSISLRENFFTIDKGRRAGIEPYMAVITPDGTIAGIVQVCSDNYSVCMSILNEKFRTAGRIKGSDHFGSIFWDGSAEDIVRLTEVSKYAKITPGDTVITDYSSFFPPDIIIGTVVGADMNKASYYDVKVKLATPPTTFKRVLLVRYADQLERMMLETEAAKANN